MGIRASYWATGGILTLLGVALAQFILPLLGGLALVVGAFLLKAALVVMVVLAVALMVFLFKRAARGRRRAEV